MSSARYRREAYSGLIPAMRANTAPLGSVEALVRALLDEFPELDRGRVRAAVERATAKVAHAQLDTEGHRFVDQHLARVEATEEATERARILRELSDSLEERRDAERALVVRLAAFAEAPAADDLDPLLRLARVTQRWSELPLDEMTGFVDINDDASPRRLTELATVWQQLGRGYRAADCLERVLALKPADGDAHESLEVFYRSTGEWPVLIDLLGRRAVHVADPERAELFREMGLIYERELGDDAGALDAYREADRLEPDHVDVVDALARLELRVGTAESSDSEALLTLERLARLVEDPTRRAVAWFRAADVARQYDYDRAQALYERARADDPELVPAIDGLAALLRDRGDLAAVVALLVEAAARPALAGERSRWLADAADFCVALADTERAKQLYREARAADPGNHKAGLALVELCWDTGDLADLAPMLDELCRTTVEPGRLRGYLLQRKKLAIELGDIATAREMLSRAVALDPHDPATRRELADLLFEAGEWREARAFIEGLLEDREDVLQPEVSVELHYRVARCAYQLGDAEGAAKHAAVTLALAPDHRPALVLRTELDVANPEALLADQLALANIAPPEEKGARFSALGDRYAELGERTTAREMYREALSHRPDDHLLLTKFLGLVADEGDWGYSLDLIQRLTDTENDLKVRARYRHLAAMISRDELDRRDEAAALFGQAIEDDPRLFTAADELEALLGDSPDREALMRFYTLRLEHVRTEEGRSGERLRLWDRLGELCLAQSRREDAVAALEVALRLDPDNLARRQRLADLYLDADPRHAADAIAQHQAVLRADKRRAASYEALRTLYRRTHQPEKARACDQALDLLGKRGDDHIAQLFGPPRPPVTSTARKPLANEDWVALGSFDVDLQLSALFALVAPALATERARTRPPQLPGELAADVPPAIAEVLGQVATSFGIARPPTVVDPGQLAACTTMLRAQGGVLAPVLVIGRPALEHQVEGPELAFALARQLADLRSDRFARLLCPRAADLAQIIELALAHGQEPPSHSGRWLATALHAVELDQALAIARRLRERGIDPVRAALSWLAATDRAADRIGLVITSDLPACVRVLERERTAAPGEVDRVIELVWASVTEEVLGVRGRIERWPTHPRQERTA
ncbi:MAG TPA: tetratricopeptide repeat protein [Kofleriaceae bacterium]|nr:tetratricopeptide repeat protein [Kofleriaceae bacterium]